MNEILTQKLTNAAEHEVATKMHQLEPFAKEIYLKLIELKFAGKGVEDLKRIPPFRLASMAIAYSEDFFTVKQELKKDKVESLMEWLKTLVVLDEEIGNIKKDE